MNQIEDVVIVGGGIGGLATALALARRNIRAVVLEQAPTIHEIGAGLQVGPNAVRALSNLGLLDAVLDIAVQPSFGVLKSATTGEELTRLDVGPSFRARYGFPYLVMHRHDLLDALLRGCVAAGVDVRTDHKVTSISQNGERAWAETEHGVIAGGVLVGADGLRSIVRRGIDDSEPAASGYVAYRGALPADEVPGSDNNDVVIWIGPGVHLVQYPVRRGAIYNQVAVFRSDRLAAGRSDWGEPSELHERFAGECEAVRSAASMMDTGMRWPLVDRPPITRWVDGRFVLLGDAAHPMLQYLGQGACQALEDAELLSILLAEAPLDEALADYQRVRVPRATRCQRSARPWGEVWHTTDPITQRLRDRLMRSRAWDDFGEVDWLYAEDPAAVALVSGLSGQVVGA